MYWSGDFNMSLVTGEDSESDEEINTEQFGGTRVTHGGGVVTGGTSPRMGIIQGEDDEDEEESAQVETKPSSTTNSSQDGLNIAPTSEMAKKWEPPTVLHKKLGDANYSLRRNIVTRLVQLYQNTCRNLTTVNDNLTRAQQVIEKVNANVKKSDEDLVQLKANFDIIFESAKNTAPGLKIPLTPQPKGATANAPVLKTETP